MKARLHLQAGATLDYVRQPTAGGSPFVTATFTEGTVYVDGVDMALRTHPQKVEVYWTPEIARHLAESILAALESEGAVEAGRSAA